MKEKNAKNNTSKILIIIQTFIIFIFPVILLYFNIISSDWKIFLLAVCSLIIYGIIKYENWTHEDMGLNNKFREYFIPYFIFTIISVALFFILHAFLDFETIKTKFILIEKLLFFLPISFLQEFAFRSFLVHRLKLLLNNNFLIIFVNTILFTLIHVVYPSLNVVLPITFIGGIFFTWLYIKYPNFLLVSLSHSVINIVAVLLGFFGTN